jgi:hypothetical protein
MKRNPAIPGWVDIATDPCMSKWKTKFGLPAALLGQLLPACVAGALPLALLR